MWHHVFSTSVKFPVVDYPTQASIAYFFVNPHPHRFNVSRDRASARRRRRPLDVLIGLGLPSLRSRERQAAANMQDEVPLHRGSPGIMM
jgi:hypothetical protein